MTSPFKICVLISGGGTTLRNLIEWKSRDELVAKIDFVISSNPSAGGLEFAKRADIPNETFWHKDYDESSLSSKVFDVCRQRGIDLVVMGGFLRKLEIPADFENRVINIHPSLIPAFCGKGFYGLKVHQAAIDYGTKLSGCTVHFVDNQFDHGPIIAQQTVPVLPTDDARTLAQRVFEKECVLYPQTINQLALGRVSISGRMVTVHT